MYMSDYGYATDLSKCNSTLLKYDDSLCESNNWLSYKEVYLWLLNSNNLNPYISWGINNNGRASTEGYICSNTISVRPVLYIDSTSRIIDGNGSQKNPYQLSIT